MRKGSVQKTALRASATRLAFTAIVSSMGSSGGMTLVTIIVQFSSSLKRLRAGSCAARGARRSEGRVRMRARHRSLDMNPFGCSSQLRR